MIAAIARLIDRTDPHLVRDAWSETLLYSALFWTLGALVALALWAAS